MRINASRHGALGIVLANVTVTNDIPKRTYIRIGQDVDPDYLPHISVNYLKVTHFYEHVWRVPVSPELRKSTTSFRFGSRDDGAGLTCEEGAWSPEGW